MKVNRIYNKFLICVALLGICASGIAQDGVVNIGDNQFKVTVSNVSMVVDGNKGARITSFKINDQEVIASNKVHPYFYGSTLWLSPEGKWKGHGALDNGIYTVQSESSNVLRLVSLPDDKRGFQFSKEFQINEKDTSITVKYIIKNISDKVQEVAPWEVTRVSTGGLAFIPKRHKDDLPRPNKMYPVPPTVDDSGTIWYPYDSNTESPQKFFMDGGDGWIAYVRDNVLFIKSFAMVDKGDSAPGESNVELYVNKEKTYVELENQGSYQNLGKNESLDYEVKWYVRKLPSTIEPKVGNMKLKKYVEDILGTKSGSSIQMRKNLENTTALLVKTMLKPDAEILNNLFSDELSYGHSGGLIENKEQIIYGLTQGPFHFETIDIKDQTVRIIGDVGVVRHVLTTNYSENGKTGTLKFGILYVWRVENGNWKLLARQAAKL
ncbi:DUF4380 domain-containing protein [Flagellimonas pelagia]|nr:DUF4380 domain-containing protein [Allomuricauda maritima]